MDIKRGEIWSVNLDPTVGAEIRKTRPGRLSPENEYAKKNLHNWMD